MSRRLLNPCTWRYSTQCLGKFAQGLVLENALRRKHSEWSRRESSKWSVFSHKPRARFALRTCMLSNPSRNGFFISPRARNHWSPDDYYTYYTWPAVNNNRSACARASVIFTILAKRNHVFVNALRTTTTTTTRKRKTLWNEFTFSIHLVGHVWRVL